MYIEQAQPLAGIRILDSTYVYALPYAAGLMADLGAEVIKIEACRHPDIVRVGGIASVFPENRVGERFWEQGGTFHTLNRGKRSLTLDLNHPAGQEIFKRLVAISDIVLENFTPRVMRKWGLDYPNLKAIKPDIIMLSNTGYGHGGPYSHYGSQATSLEATQGTAYLTGYIDGPPAKAGFAYTDFLACWTALFALFTALLYRRRTGKGQWIDLGMYQLGVAFIGEAVIDYMVNGAPGGTEGQRHRGTEGQRDKGTKAQRHEGEEAQRGERGGNESQPGRRVQMRLGNRHPTQAPYGCYRCRGRDRWITVAISDTAEWEALCKTIGHPELLQDSRLQDAQGRWKHHDELDRIIESWTREQDPYAAMHRLQEAGVPAGVVMDTRDLLRDPHLKARGFFEMVEQAPSSEAGKRPVIGRPWKLSATPVRIRRAAPTFGQDNDYVLKELLQMPDEEIERLRGEGIIGEKPAGLTPPRLLSPAEMVRLGRFAYHDPEYRKNCGIDEKEKE
ncbi:MAG: CoA transferase [Nitrospinota bacterium]|nr:MAG: CoA transferase [Nitrospinota bacterium]